MFRQKEAGSPDNVDTLIGVNSVFEGNLESQGTVRVDGKMKGDLRISGDLFIGNQGSIIGNVFANSVHLAGAVEGNIHSPGLLRILTTARLYGDIQVHSFVADEGAVFQGKCSMLDVPAIEHTPERPSTKKSHSSKDYRKSSVLDQAYDEKEKKNDLMGE